MRLEIVGGGIRLVRMVQILYDYSGGYGNRNVVWDMVYGLWVTGLWRMFYKK